MSDRVTDACPQGRRCESCGDDHEDVSVQVRKLGGAGPACLTLCPHCANSRTEIPVTADTAVRLVAQHDKHLRQAELLAAIPVVTPGRGSPVVLPHPNRTRV